MKYLFFDIEASEGRSMCSFGYVLTDEAFNVLEKEDILINPEARFCTQAWSKKKRDEGKGITLAYPEKTFFRSPNFPKQYDRIKSIIEKEDRMVVGFSHTNDVRYLCTACRRYKKPFFSYRFIDVQDVYREFNHVANQISLEKIIAELEIDVEGFTLHKSSDDAEISMLVAKAICERKGLTMSGMIERYSRYVGETNNGEIKYNGIDSERALVKKAKNYCRGVVAAFANNRKINYCKGSKLNNKKICAGAPLEKDEWVFALKLVECLAAKGARYIGNVKEADYYVVFGENEGENGDRLAHIKQTAPNAKIKIISKEELYAMMGMTEEEIKSFSLPKIERLRAQTERYVNKILKNVDEEMRPSARKLS